MNLFSQKQRLNKNTKYPVDAIVFSWFIGFFLALYFMFKTFITIDATFHFFLLFGAITTIINILIKGKISVELLKEAAFISFFGIASIITGLFLLLNFYFRGPSYDEVYKIEKVTKNLDSFLGGNKEVQLQNGQYKEFDYIIDYDKWLYSELYEAQEVKLEVANGLFGYKVFLSEDLIFPREMNNKGVK